MKIPRIKYDFSKITKKPLATVLVLVLVVSSVISLTLLQKPSSAKAAWYTTGGTWQYRQMITIDHSKVPNTDQADFPVLIKITDPTNPVFAQALSSGYDIMFTAADTTTPRSYEIEKFDPTNHELDVWVKIPTLSHTVDTAIYMYYGNSAATAPVTSIAQAVWSNGYAGVWHQNESSGTFYDSSSCLKNGSISGSVGYSASGKIGKAADLTGGYIDIADSDTLSPTGTGLLSLGAWIKPDTLIGSNTVLSKYTAGNVPNSEYLLFVRSDGIGFYLDGTNPSNYEVGGVVPYAFQTGLWYHIDAIYNGNTMGIYVNGNFIGNAATPGSKILSNSPVSAKIGGGYSSNFAGIIDEPKISNTTRSADWIATEYANQSSPSTFISLGGQTFYDGIAPSNPTVISAYSDSGLSSPLVSGNFYNYATPYFVWPAAQAAGGAHDTGDNGIVSGVAGYYSYFGTSCGSGGGNPAQSPGILSDTGGGLHFSTSPNITIPSLGTNEGTYCLRIKASDNAGNINSTTWEAYSAYKYDSSVPNVPSFIAVNPAGYSSVDSFDFSWPAASDVINASASGLAGYQYERGGTSGDSWSATITDLQIKGIKSYQSGNNIFLLRSIDNAGNVSASIQTTYYFSSSAPTKPTSIIVSPSSTSDVNSFSFSWTAPVSARPIAEYGYVINPTNSTPTIQNLQWTNSSATTLPLGPYATKQGVNKLYLVAKDDSGSYALSDANIATVSFTCTSVAPPIPTGIFIKDSSNRETGNYQLTLQWSPGANQDAGSFSHYSVERSTDGTNFAEITTYPLIDSTKTPPIYTATTVPPSISDSNLDNSTLYYYRVKAIDNAGAVSSPSAVVSKIPTGKYTSPPTILSEPTAVAKSSTATISWVVDRASSASVRFGTDKNNLSASQISTAMETSHTISLASLTPGVRYYYQVQSLDPGSLRDYSPSDVPFSVVYFFDTISSPSLANITISNITLNSADVTWETTSASNTKVYFGTSINYGFVLPENDKSMTTKHSVKITNLADTTRYHFNIHGADIDGNILTSDDYVFDTLPKPNISSIDYQIDYTAPTPSATITWLSNVPVTSSVQYGLQTPADSKTKEASQSAFDVRHSVTLPDLMYDTSYKFILSGVDQFGNNTVSDVQIMKTNIDTRPPKITNITFESSNVGSGGTDTARVVVYWKTDKVATSQVSYDNGIAGTGYKSSTPLDSGLTNNHIVIISGLSPGTPYHFQVMSKDADGNLALGADQVVITGQVTQSVFTIISDTFNNIFGWMKYYQ